MICAENIDKSVSYCPETGRFWRNNKEHNCKNPDICINGKTYKKKVLAYYLVHGEWPDFRLQFNNGDKTDFRIENIGRLKAHNFIDLTGQRFNYLVVTEFVGLIYEGSKLANGWLCQCDCGGTKTVSTYHLRIGHVTSCGCQTYNQDSRKTTYEYRNTPEYYCWSNIKNRCYNPNSTYYYLYGERGIKVCDRWKKSFFNFLEDMGERPENANSIERVDNNGDYEPDNCRWATHTEQAYNTRRNHHITIGGVTKNVEEWAKESPVTRGCICRRLSDGWSNENAVYTPHVIGNGKRNCSHYFYNGAWKSAREISEETGVALPTLYRKIKNGWEVEDIVAKYARSYR